MSKSFTFSIQPPSTTSTPINAPPTPLQAEAKSHQPDPGLLQLYSETFEEQLLEILNAKFQRNDGHRSLCIEFADELLGHFLDATQYLKISPADDQDSKGGLNSTTSTKDLPATPNNSRDLSKNEQGPELWRNGSDATRQDEMTHKTSVSNQDSVAPKQGTDLPISRVLSPTPYIKRDGNNQSWEVMYSIDDSTSSDEHQAYLTTTELMETLKQCLSYEEDLRNKLKNVWSELPRIDQWIRKKRKLETENKENATPRQSDDSIFTEDIRNRILAQIQGLYDDNLPKEEVTSPKESFSPQTRSMSSPIKELSGKHTPMKMRNLTNFRHNPTMTPISKNYTHNQPNRNNPVSTPIAHLQQQHHRNNLTSSPPTHTQNNSLNDYNPASQLRKVVTLADVGNLDNLEELSRINESGNQTHNNELNISNNFDDSDSNTHDIIDGIIGIKQLVKTYDAILDESNSVSNQATFFTQLANEFCSGIQTDW